jgi:hypothetical protein
MRRDAMMVFRLTTAMRDALIKAAEAEQRSVSNMTVVIVGDWLRSKGYFTDTPTPAPRTKKKGK